MHGKQRMRTESAPLGGTDGLLQRHRYVTSAGTGDGKARAGASATVRLRASRSGSGNSWRV
eukprot:3358722-Rhodomonas_salina.1